MSNLPIIVASGGINAAGRSSHRLSHRRLVVDSLDAAEQARTWRALQAMMMTDDIDRLRAGTLVRAIESSHFDPTAVPVNRRMRITDVDKAIHMKPEGIAASKGQAFDQFLNAGDSVLVPSHRRFEVSAAGQLPTGFEPGKLYPSRNHPRGLQMSIFAMSDALADLGIEWDAIKDRVHDEDISVYVSSSMGQLDGPGTGGMLSARASGQRVTSKQCPLGFAEMPGDFINAYVLQTQARTGPALGACATFLYNLQLGVQDITSGRARIAIVGAAEAPIVPEVMEGYVAMGALATDKGLLGLDGLGSADDIDFRRACRPFAYNCGFVMAESAQIVVLMDDDLALSMGAPMLGAVPDVSVHADGAKKSISSPGVGNYLTMARAAGAIRDILGADRMTHSGAVMAHGTGTPQNRVTESAIMSRVAKAFDVDQWQVSAIKSHTGHSLGAAGGDQLSALLGVWETGWLPGISTVDSLAHDIETERLAIAIDHTRPKTLDYGLVNSKGFGGNNATAAILSPDITKQLLAQRHGDARMAQWSDAAKHVEAERHRIEASRLEGDWEPRYLFNQNVIDDDQVVSDLLGLSIGDVDLPLNERRMPKEWELALNQSAS